MTARLVFFWPREEPSLILSQNIVKKLFGNEEFRNKYQLGAVNSINWARILAQTVYYFKAYFSLESKIGKGQKVIFSVPTGNFGDILAGHYARQMGLPIERLIIATNQNDILHRVFAAGAYSKDAELGVQPTHSPAMDILVSSNFERLLWYLTQAGDAPQACATLSRWMSEFGTTGRIQLPEAALNQLRDWFSSSTVDDSKVNRLVCYLTFRRLRSSATSTPPPLAHISSIPTPPLASELLLSCSRASGSSCAFPCLPLAPRRLSAWPLPTPPSSSRRCSWPPRRTPRMPLTSTPSWARDTYRSPSAHG